MSRTVLTATGRDSVSEILDLLARHYRSGEVASFSTECSPLGTIRFTIVYSPGVEPLDLPGVSIDDGDTDQG